jgi:predicted Ser/Thr protein kinase
VAEDPGELRLSDDAVADLLSLASAESDLMDADLPASLRAARAAGFEPVGRLGRGGLAEVWRGTDANTGCDVAIKVARVDRDGGESMLAREARALAAVGGGGVVRLIRQGGRGHSHFLVLEYVEGPSLAEVVDAGQLSADEAIRLMIDLCDSLQRVHDLGWLHGDCKPSNVLVRPAGTGVLIDFGLSVPTDAEFGFISGYTARGATSGFAAPEYADEPGWTPTRAGDIYALGRTLETLARAGGAHSRKRVRAALQRATSTDPADRFPSVGELASALGADDGPTGGPLKLRRWAAGAAVAVALTAGAAVLSLTQGGVGDQPAADRGLSHPPVAAALMTIGHAIEQQRWDEATRLLEAVPPGQRGWEWRHLWTTATQPPATSSVSFPTGSSASCIDVSARRWLTASPTGDVRSIGFDGEVHAPLFQVGQAVRDIRALGDGRVLLATSAGVEQRDASGARRVIPGRAGHEPAVVWLGAQGDVFSWSRRDREVLSRSAMGDPPESHGRAGLVLVPPSVKGHFAAVDDTPEDYRLQLIGHDGAVVLEDRFERPNLPLCVDRDGPTGLTAVATGSGEVRLYNPDGQVRHRLVVREGEPVTALVLGESERRLFAVDDSEVHVLDTATGELVCSLPFDLPGIVSDVYWDSLRAELLICTDLGAQIWSSGEITQVASR